MRELFDESVEAPEGARTGARQPVAWAGEGKVLTGERRPGEVGAAGKISSAEVVDVADAQRLATPVLPISARLFCVDVVGEETGPAFAEPGADHAAAAEEFVKARPGRHRRIALVHPS